MEMAMVDFFKQAKPVTAPKPPSAKKGEKDMVEIEDLEVLGALTNLEKLIETAKKTVRGRIDDQHLDLIVEEGLKLGRRPDNYDGFEGKVTASMQFQKRNSRSALNDLEKEMLTQYGIATEEVGDVVETFIFNPAYADLAVPENAEMFDKISAALTEVPGIPADIIQRQVANKKTVVVEKSLDQIFDPTKWSKEMAKQFARAPKDTMKLVVTELARIVGTLAIRPVFSGSSAEAFEIAKKQILEEAESEQVRKDTVDAIKETTGAAKKKAPAKDTVRQDKIGF